MMTKKGMSSLLDLHLEALHIDAPAANTSSLRAWIACTIHKSSYT